jgi:predicted helicase
MVNSTQAFPKDKYVLANNLAERTRRIRIELEQASNTEALKNGWHQLKRTNKNIKHADYLDGVAQLLGYGLLCSRWMVHLESQDITFNKASALGYLILAPREFRPLLVQMFHGTAQLEAISDSISGLIEWLMKIEMGAVFNPLEEDPVIHFYEIFLKAYAPTQRRYRGVYYTPTAVLNYVVRQTHNKLVESFGLKEGLASSESWSEVMDCGSNETQDIDSPCQYVRILDPAMGTGGFLVAAIDKTFSILTAKWDNEGRSALEKHGLWQEYVTSSLLPNLHGIELLIAPYSIAHMKISLKLMQTGAAVQGDELHLQLGNALELEWPNRTTVVIGNPPYSGLSSNMSDSASKLIESFKYIQGKHFGERKHWLHDDYVKFTGKSEESIRKTGFGLLAFVTNHSFIDNASFRGMRWNLLQTFDDIDLLNLHGNRMRKGKGKDENLFEIQQGICIAILSRTGKSSSPLRYAELRGRRRVKEEKLQQGDFITLRPIDMVPADPLWLFSPQINPNRKEYESYLPVSAVFSLFSGGFITARDRLVVAYSEEELRERLDEFRDPEKDDFETRDRFFPRKSRSKYISGDTRSWKLVDARKKLERVQDLTLCFRRCLYRPFDWRFVYWSGEMVDWPRKQTQEQLLHKGNLGLVFMRQVASDYKFSHVLVTDVPVDARACYSNKGILSMAPLWVYDKEGIRRSNIEPSVIQGTRFETMKDPSTSMFYYIIALLHSQIYRQRFQEMLKEDFPRVPFHYTGDIQTICRIGEKISKVYSEESVSRRTNTVGFIGRDRSISKPIRDLVVDSHGIGTLFINSTSGFTNIPLESWEARFGGYQVASKWLNDRKKRGALITQGEALQYIEIIQRIGDLIAMSKEVDGLIEHNGGWSQSFAKKQ